MSKQTGQMIVTLILVMTVALAIGLSIIQRSLTDVATSTKVEQSARAFSAAEAAIEKALKGDTSGVNFQEVGSQAKISGGDPIPAVSSSGNRQAPLEYPPLAKEDIAHVWLADPNSTLNPPATHYTQNTLDVYWGNSSSDRPAIELTLVFYNGSKFDSKKWYLDQAAAGRAPANGFEAVGTCNGGNSPPSGTKTYQCKKTLGAAPDASLPGGLMLIRARLLYNLTSQPFAAQAVGTCGKNCSLPPQARIFTSVGTSGETQRSVQVFRLEKVVPPYFDYAIFSAGEIRK